MAQEIRRSSTRRHRLVAALATTSVAAAALVVPLSGTAGAEIGGASACAAPANATSPELNSTVGITPKTVSVGNISILSGPVPGLFQGAPYGAEAYFAYVNSKGGIHGRKITLHSLDDGFSGTQNEAEAQQSIASDFAMVGSFSLFDNYSCNVFAKNPGVSDVSATLDPGTNSLPNVFSPEPISQGAPLAGYVYLKSKYPKAITHVASLISNVATSIAQWQGQEAAMEHEGYKFVYTREISPVESDFTTDVINMKNKGVKIVMLSNGTAAVYAALTQDMAEQGFHPEVMLSNGPIYTSTYVKMAGGKQNADGTWLIQDLSLYLGQDAKSIPAVKTFNSWMAKTHPGFTPDLFTVFGWASAQLFTQALQAAGPNPTRGKLLAQLKKITDFDASGLVGPANPAKKIPPNCVVFARIENGNFVRVAPTAKAGWDCSQPYFSINGGILPKVKLPSS